MKIRRRRFSVGTPLRALLSMLEYAVLLTTMSLAGCVSGPSPAELRSTPIAAVLPQGAPPVVDGRAGFRPVFCSELASSPHAPAAARPCNDWLWRLPDEPPPELAGSEMAGRSANTVDVVLVPGAFSECFGDEAQPFADGAQLLRSRGYRVETLVVSGRSGTEHNAQQIAAALARYQVTPGHKLVLVGFSKGSMDTLRFLVDFPAQARMVDAVVSVGGPIMGTPAANVGAGTYAALLKKIPQESCAPGDGLVLESLKPETQGAWMAAHSLPARVRYYSTAGFAARDRIARALVPSWRYLSKIDTRNDGQVVANRALIPGSTLLGYVNADHWGLAMHNEKYHPYLVKRRDGTSFPTATLLSAIVAFVERDLSATAPEPH